MRGVNRLRRGVSVRTRYVAAVAVVAATAGTAAAAAPETTTYSYNTCDGLTKPTDVAVQYHCYEHTITKGFKNTIVAKASSPGAFAVAHTKPTRLDTIATKMFIVTRASPRQVVSVSWSMVCSDEDGGANATSGSYVSSSSRRHYLKMAVPSGEHCSPAAFASLTEGHPGSHLKLRIWARVPGHVISEKVTRTS